MISFLNGEFKNNDQCFIHIEDRGSQFGDSIYDVILVENNKFIDFELHFKRIKYSLSKLSIDYNITKEYLLQIMKQLLQKNNLNNGSFYIQISRGYAGQRNQLIPKKTNITFFCKPSLPKDKTKQINSVKSFNDLRWGRCDIKTTALLYSSMVKSKATDAGFDDAIFIKDNFITECSFANFFWINNKNELITRNSDNTILAGITRKRIIILAKENNIKVMEKKFTLSDISKAKEAFMSSSTLKIRPIGTIDNIIISDKIGPITKKIQNLYQNFIQK